MTKVIVEIPTATDHRWKSWRRVVERVDRSLTNGYAFEGPWLSGGRKAELEVGTVVLLYDEVGSRAHHEPEVRVARVTEEGKLDVLLQARGKDWALDLRDRVADLLTRTEDRRAVLEREAETLRRRLAEIEAELASLV
jgi:hypothetical protein